VTALSTMTPDPISPRAEEQPDTATLKGSAARVERVRKSIPRRVFEFFSGFGLATVLLTLLLLLTWLGTLEQVENGLFLTAKKYFDSNAFFLVPELNGKRLPIVLPGVYWVSALLFINLFLGGIVRMRKGWRVAGVLISHCGILFMLVGAFVTHRWEVRGNMAISEGQTSNVAEHYFDYVIELTEVRDGKLVEPVHVIGEQHLADLEPSERRMLRLSNLPFDLEVMGYMRNADPRPMTDPAPANGERVINDYYLMERPLNPQAEANFAGTYARPVEKDGTAGEPFILPAASYKPYTLRHGERTFLVAMRKRLWVLPFAVTLDKFTADFYEGTMRPRKFVSEITRKDNDIDSHVVIEMNMPMRYSGLTFFQASWGPQDAKPGTPLFSVFEVVRNPADKWPEYSLYIVTFGLLVHFVMKLAGFVVGATRKSNVRA
jgi:hypothetical protein